MASGTDFRSRQASRGATVRDVMALFRRRWWVVVACVVLIPAAVYVYSTHQPKTYEASVVVQPDPTTTAIGGNDQTPSQNFVGTLEGYAGLGQVAGATARLLHRPYGDIEDLRANISTDTGWLTLIATAATPSLAVNAANAYATALTNYVRGDARSQLDKQIVGVRQSLALTRNPLQRREARDTLASLTAVRDATTRPLRVVASPHASKASPHPTRNALLALLLAVLIAPALVVAVDRLDRTVRRPTELERLSGAALLAGIPKEAFAGAGGSRSDRAFERLRDSLIFFDPDRRPDSVAVVSPLEDEGRTAVAVGLARSFARAGRRVMLVDADLRAPDVAARMDMLASPGLSDVLEGGYDLDGAVRRVGGFESELTVLPAGSPSQRPVELLGSDAMSRLLARLSEEFDFVIIDTAPLLVTGGALALVSRSSGVVSVGRLQQPPHDAVRRMMRMVTDAGGHMLGIVATDASSGGSDFEAAPLGGASQGGAAADAAPSAPVARVG
jgi:capsular exopolysaccharide synthesis family protein